MTYFRTILRAAQSWGGETKAGGGEGGEGAKTHGWIDIAPLHGDDHARHIYDLLTVRPKGSRIAHLCWVCCETHSADYSLQSKHSTIPYCTVKYPGQWLSQSNCRLLDLQVNDAPDTTLYIKHITVGMHIYFYV